MLRTFRQAIRIAVAPMLFLFMFLSFRPYVEPPSFNDVTTTVDVHATTLVFSVFLKDSEEKEHDGHSSITNCAPLLDLVSHLLHLQDMHKAMYSMFLHGFLILPENNSAVRLCKLLIWSTPRAISFRNICAFDPSKDSLVNGHLGYFTLKFQRRPTFQKISMTQKRKTGLC